MQLPKKGKTVSLEEIKKLCIYFNLIYLWEKIKDDPPAKLLKFDGCSCWPDIWKNKNGKKVNLYEECLRHDLLYWAGYPKETIERFLADTELMIDVILKTERIWLGLIMFLGVRIGGSNIFPTPFKWGFGRT